MVVSGPNRKSPIQTFADAQMDGIRLPHSPCLPAR